MEKSNLKPFDVEKAKAGAKVITRCGLNAIYLASIRSEKPLVFALDCPSGQNLSQFYINGTNTAFDSNLDLFMLPETKEGWVNIYETNNPYVGEVIFKSYHEGNLIGELSTHYITTTKITWEE